MLWCVCGVLLFTILLEPTQTNKTKLSEKRTDIRESIDGGRLGDEERPWDDAENDNAMGKGEVPRATLREVIFEGMGRDKAIIALTTDLIKNSGDLLLTKKNSLNT